MKTSDQLDSEGLYQYPGQLSAIALCIVMKFENLSVAGSRPAQYSYPLALSDGEIPGAGGTVYAALDFLHYIEQGKVKEALAWEEKVWANEEKTFDKEGKGRRAIPELRKRLFEALKSKWGWNIDLDKE